MNQSVAAISPSRVSRSSAPCEGISFGDFVLFPIARMLYHRGAPLELGSRKLDILRALVERAGEVVSHRELMSAAWRDLVVEYGNLRVQINGLRKALGEGAPGARYIANVPGQGYSFVAPIERWVSQRAAVLPRHHGAGQCAHGSWQPNPNNTLNSLSFVVSKNKRDAHFAWMTDAEVTQSEAVVAESFGGL